VTVQEDRHPSNKKASALSEEELTEQLVLAFTRIRHRLPTGDEKKRLKEGAKYAKYEQGLGMNWKQLVSALESGDWDPAKDSAIVLKTPM
jgi:hypothetical protein